MFFWQSETNLCDFVPWWRCAFLDSIITRVWCLSLRSTSMTGSWGSMIGREHSCFMAARDKWNDFFGSADHRLRECTCASAFEFCCSDSSWERPSSNACMETADVDYYFSLIVETVWAVLLHTDRGNAKYVPKITCFKPPKRLYLALIKLTQANLEMFVLLTVAYCALLLLIVLTYFGSRM